MGNVFENRLLGDVKWFNSKRGYGFICDKDGNEYFLHITNMNKKNDKLQWPHPGDSVEFEIKQHEKGIQAINVDIKKRAKVKKEM